MKRVARNRRRTAVIEAVLDPVVVPIPLTAVPVEVANVKVAIRVAICVECLP